MERRRYIYSDYKRCCRGTARSKTVRGFAEYCFLCSKWMHSEAAWIDHCQSSHLDKPETLLSQCDPLTHARTLAAPGLCFWCLVDKLAPAETRMRQFLDRASWQKHIEEEHHARLNDGKTPICPHPSCKEAFDSLTELMYYLQDDHCWVPEQPLKRKQPVVDEEVPCKETKAQSGPKRRQRPVRSLGACVRG